jgi:hypothetical protein
MANPDRKDGGGLSLLTLVIASAASLTAAMVTSRLFPPGTIYASAMTPVIVAAVSEMLHRPAARASALRDQRRTMVLESRERQAARVLGDDPSPLSGAPDFAQGAGAEGATATNGDGAHPPHRPRTTVYGPGERERGASPWRRIHPKVAIATGLAAFAIAVAVLTLPELLFGGAVANKHRTTFFGGGATTSQPQSETKTQTQTQTGSQSTPTTVTETVPAQTPPQSTQTDTTTTDTGTGTETAPSGGAPAPTQTDTSTTPAPSGSVPPVP